jgi:hypothetical protein
MSKKTIIKVSIGLLAAIAATVLLFGSLPTLAKQNAPPKNDYHSTINGKVTRFGYDINYQIKIDAQITGISGNLPICQITATAKVSAFGTGPKGNKPTMADGSISSTAVMSGAYGVYQSGVTLSVPFSFGTVQFMIVITSTNGILDGVVTPL